MNYYIHHIGDHLKVAGHLTPPEGGFLERLKDKYFIREAGLPENDVARLVGATKKDEIATLNRVLSEFFELVSGVWVQHHWEAEIEVFLGKSLSCKRSAGARWEKQKQNTEGNADVMRTHSEGNAKAMPRARVPITNSQYPITSKTNTSAVAPPHGVVESVWADFVELRKSKRAKVTQTAIDTITREAASAGWSLENALRECCARGWTGFKAEWVADKSQAKASPESYRERDDRLARERIKSVCPSIAAKAPHSQTVVDITPTPVFGAIT